LTRISIIVPTKDRPHFLRRAVASACASGGENDEIIIVDDHSEIPATVSLQQLDDPRLRIKRMPRGASGVSAARNLGIASAHGDIFAFLDDDDELEPQYLAHIRNTASRGADYGFSSYILSDGSCPPNIDAAKARFAEGYIAANAPPHRKTFGFGMGFWMTRDTADLIGQLDTSLSINEDTDYACRLWRADRRGWYSANPGVIVHDHFGKSAGQLGNTTGRVNPAERARCMKALCDRYPEFIDHLGRGYIRHCLRAGRVSDAVIFVREQPLASVRARLRAYLYAKRIGYGLRRSPPVKT
jgi:glycosyltransferase involved in cell wall biosynthesis